MKYLLFTEENRDEVLAKLESIGITTKSKTKLFVAIETDNIEAVRTLFPDALIEENKQRTISDFNDK